MLGLAWALALADYLPGRPSLLRVVSVGNQNYRYYRLIQVNKRISNNKYLYGALLVIVLLLPFLFMLVSIRLGLFDTVSDADVEKTRAACADLAPPPGFTKIRDFEMVKSTSVVFSTHYRSESPPENVEKYFTDLLVPRGWKARVDRNQGTVRLIFQRDKVSIDVEYNDFSFTSDRQYGVACSFGLP